MKHIKAYRLFGIFVLFFLLFNFPLISIFDKEGFIAGMPTLYFYLFGIWMLMIVFLFIIMENKKRR
ncbi:MAG: hypothetical protein R3E32_27575 [Chitinophagales bacterium]